jgi:DNA end-binding protein Ku
VVVNKQDFIAANPKATQTIDIEDFVSVDEIDPMFFEKPYYILPEKNAAKSYVLLRDALTKSRKVAIGKVVIRTKQHLAALMAHDDFLILEILRFAHEVRDLEEAKSELTKKKAYNARELKMAEDLINSMSGEWKPSKYKDTYYLDLKKRINTKVKQGKTHVIEPEEEISAPEQPTENVVDLIPLLRKSLAENVRKRKKAK